MGFFKKEKNEKIEDMSVKELKKTRSLIDRRLQELSPVKTASVYGDPLVEME